MELHAKAIRTIVGSEVDAVGGSDEKAGADDWSEWTFLA